MGDIKARISILGAGKIGEILIRGLTESHYVLPEEILVTAGHPKRVESLAGLFGVRPCSSNPQAAQAGQTILLCVKPRVAIPVLREISGVLRPDHLVISVAASVPLSAIENCLGDGIPVVRAMPNTPCLVRSGMTVLAKGRHAADQHLDTATRIFSSVGRVRVLEERYMDPVTGLSASGPAFIFVAIESLAEGGVKAGLPREIATELAAQAVLGAARMVLDTGEHPAALKDAVTTPAGCTIDGLLELEEGGFRVTLIKAVMRAAERARELYREPNF